MNDFSRVYGEALYELSSEEGKEDLFLSQMKIINDVLNENIEYYKIIDNPSVAVNEKDILISDAFSGKIDIYLLNFLKLLSSKSSLYQFRYCTKHFEKVYNEKHSIETVVITAAVSLSEEQKDKIVDILKQKTGKNIQLTIKKEKAIRGGLRCEMSGKRIDNSVESRLKLIRHALLSKSM